MDIDSTPGLGTTVTIFLPRADAAELPASKNDNGQIAPAAPTKILVVEDDELVRKFATTALTVAGYEVTAVADGKAALKALDTMPPPDLLFCGVLLLGGMSGRDVAQSVREKCPAIAMLFASGYPREHLTDENRLLPGVELLTKPFNGRTLLERVEQALADQTEPYRKVVPFSRKRT